MTNLKTSLIIFLCLQYSSQQGPDGPIFSQDKYEYTIATRIPKGFDFTKLIPISADYDKAGKSINFEIENNDYVKTGLKATQEGDTFFTTLTSVEDISEPITETLTLTANVEGEPGRSSKVTVDLNVGSLKGKESIAPPIFKEHIYFADYTSSNEFLVKQKFLIVKHHDHNIILKQIGYENFFTVKFVDEKQTEVLVTKTANLPKHILDEREFIVIEIEATIDEQKIPGWTTLLVRLPKFYENDREPNLTTGATGETVDTTTPMSDKTPTTEDVTALPETTEEPHNNYNGKKCKRIEVDGSFSNAYVIPLVLFLVTVSCIVFINMYAIILFTRNENDVFRIFQKNL